MTNGEARWQRACGTMSIATWNIRDGRSTGLYSAARALERMNVDVAVVQETKFTNTDFAARKWAGFDILTAAAATKNCGGIALLIRANARTSCVLRTRYQSKVA